MEQTEVIQRTAAYVQNALAGEATGHDWWHIERVRKTARMLAKQEGADPFIVEIAALLHDIADWKFQDGDLTAGPRRARAFLETLDVEEPIIAQICDIIEHVSFKGAGVSSQMTTKEGMVVQDADRLDAMGALGIARTFAYGGFRGRPLYHPDLKPKQHATFDEYRKGAETTINHFYEKLLLLKDRMNTATARQLADARHAFMERFLEEFFQEWNGER